MSLNPFEYDILYLLSFGRAGVGRVHLMSFQLRAYILWCFYDLHHCQAQLQLAISLEIELS